MLRHLFTLVSALSLLLSAAVVVLWVRSYWRSDVLQFPDRLHAAMTSPGAAWVITADRPYWDGTPWHRSDAADAAFYRKFGPTFGYTVRPAPGGTSHAALGFVHLSYVEASRPPCRFTYIAVPLWFPLLVSLVMPAIWLRLGRRRASAGHCPRCGYDPDPPRRRSPPAAERNEAGVRGQSPRISTAARSSS